nr:hypothetical protein [uncultured Caproiciproducens sp.]
MKIADVLVAWPHKSITLDDLQKHSGIFGYDEFYSEVLKCVESGALSAVKAYPQKTDAGIFG